MSQLNVDNNLYLCGSEEGTIYRIFLPELPEERYHCSLIMDTKKKYVYLFGGFCHNKEDSKNCNEILRLNIENMMIWEKILVVQGKELLERNSCGVVCNSDKKNIVYILGGKDNSKELTNSIIECDINKRTAKKMAAKLKYKSSFINQQGASVSLTTYVLFDKKGNVHRVNFQSFDIYTNIEEEEELHL